MTDNNLNVSDGALHFFICADSSAGFISLTESTVKNGNMRLFAISGGPGTGKSGIIRTVAKKFGDENTEIIHCAKDPDSLDAVFLGTEKCAVIDATPPHGYCIKYPGICESGISLEKYTDETLLWEKRDETVRLFDEERKFRALAARYLSAVSAVTAEFRELTEACLYREKLEAFALRLAAKTFKPVKHRTGTDRARFLSAITGKGTVFLDGYLPKDYRTVVIDDAFDSAAMPILRILREKANACGYDTVSCYCPVSAFSRLEHLIIPSLHTAFLSLKKAHPLTVSPSKLIRTERFYDTEALREKRGRLSLSGKLAARLSERAFSLSADAAECHGKLEAIYGAATDFSKVDLIIRELTERIGKKTNAAD